MKNLKFVIFISLLLSLGACTENQNMPEVTIPGLTAENLIAEFQSVQDEPDLVTISTESIEEDLEVAVAASRKAINKRTNWTPILRFKDRFRECVTVTESGDDFPKTITIDYGDSCVSKWGKTIKGVVTITISDKRRSAGSVYTVDYENVSIGDYSIELDKIITNEGENDEGNWVISHQITKTITTPKGVSKTHNINRSKEWIEGYDTPQYFDNVFYKTGSSEVTRDSLVYSREIKVPIMINRSCRFPLSGVVEIDRNGIIKTIDYGEGECDNIATVTIDDVTEEFNLATKKYTTQNRFRKGNK